MRASVDARHPRDGYAPRHFRTPHDDQRAHRWFTAVAVILAALVTIAGTGFLLTSGRATAVVTPQSLLTRTTPLLGVVGASGGHLAVEKASAIHSVTIVLAWSEAEHTRTSTSSSYIAAVNRHIAAAYDDGFTVFLDPGLQYPPNWVFSLGGGVRFVDQYGDRFSGPPTSGNDVANGVTDLKVRAAMQSYLAWLGHHLLLRDVTGVRQGGGPFDELRYPIPYYKGHTDCYWAYDSSSHALSTALHYVPGRSTEARASAFLARYNADLVSFADWMNAQYRTDFGKDILLLLPGWGQRPGVAHTEESHLLRDSYPEFNEGLDWTGLLSSLPDRSMTIAYTTYLDAPSYAANPLQEDPADYLASIVGPLHMTLGGENSGGDTVQEMQGTLGRARALGLVVVNWFNEAQLVASSQDPADGGPTFGDLAAAARADL
jgi:hypothetical protein